MKKILRLLDIIYYQAYFFYAKKLKEDDPHFETTWSMGAALSFLIIFSLLSIKDVFFCNDIPVIILTLVGFSIILLLYIYFSKNKKREKIITEKPLLKNNLFYSRLVTLIYFLSAILMMILGPILSKYFSEIYCGHN